MWDVGEVRARLAAAAKADSGFERFGVATHRYRHGPVLAEEKVAAFEAWHGVRLPDSYREFLLTVGDGGAGPFYGLYRLDGSDMYKLDREERALRGHLATPFPHVDAWNTNDTYGSPTWLPDEEYFDPRWSTGSLIIGHEGCGHMWRLVVTGPPAGRMWADSRVDDSGMTPGPPFTDWYLGWLNSLPA